MSVFRVFLVRTRNFSHSGKLLYILAPDGSPSNFTQFFYPENQLNFSWVQPGMNVDYWNTDISKNLTWMFVVYYGKMIAKIENRVEVLNGQYFNVTVDRDDGLDIFYSKISSQSNGAEGSATNVTCIVPPLRFCKCSNFVIILEGCIQNPAKHLGWSFFAAIVNS